MLVGADFQTRSLPRPPLPMETLGTPQRSAMAPIAAAPPSFVSPTAAAGASSSAMHTLSGGARKKLKKRSLSDAHKESTQPQSAVRHKIKKRLEQRIYSAQGEATQHTAKKLVFAGTPVKSSSGSKVRQRRDPEATTKQLVVAGSSSSSDSSSSDSEASSASSDECEVAFEAVTLGDTRIIRQASASPLSTCSTSSSTSSTRPVGLEYRFNVASTVSSIAVAPNGKFLVAGFYNGNVFLYPLTTDSFRFRRGVLLDQITARGMYTQLMVRVALPDDGKFIFAGVYRGSTEIRAFEVDSITFPSSAATAASLAHDSSDSENDDESHGEFGMPTARAISHTYSDAKLKGFGAVKSVLRPSTNATEYHLLCGLGIKNIHLWRFFKAPDAQEWSWECIFDKQTNGISLEFITFHPTLSNQIISKSEHQNIRIWTLEEEHDSDFTSVTMLKKSHVDVKGTIDTAAVYGDYAYGGSESLAVVELATATRQELELPLSTKEQDAAQKETANSTNSRMTAMMRSRNQRSSGRRRGGADDSGMRHMRTISQVAGRDASPFTVGMCTDGSVFLYHPSKTSGLVTPLEYIEGYEQFFQDPSLSFQAQFSDLTRVNTSGLLAVLPLPPTEREDWMIVAANQDQLLVRSYKAFLYRNQQKTEIVQVQRGLRRVMRDLGGRPSGASSSESSDGSSSDSGSDRGSASEKINRADTKRRVVKKEQGRDLLNLASTTPPPRQHDQPPKHKSKPIKVIEKERKQVPTDSTKKADIKNSSKDVIKNKKSALTVAEKISLAASIEVNELNEEPLKNSVTTPKHSSTPRNSFSATVASPVVSISSCSSNPNTPEQVGLTRLERQLKAIQELEWTPPPKPLTVSKDSNAKNGAALIENSSTSQQSKNFSKQRETSSSVKDSKIKPRLKAQALFTDIEDQEKENSNAANVKALKNAPLDQTSSICKKRSPAMLDTSPEQESPTKILKKSEKQTAKSSDQMRALVNATRKQPEACSSNDAMTEEGEVNDDEELEELERCEPLFQTFPLFSDGGSLLAASLFQYKESKTYLSQLNGSESPVSTDALPVALSPMLVAEKAQLLSNFADQMSRLQMNFETEKCRLYQLHEWSSKKKTSQASSGCGSMNWKKSLLSEYSKKKQLKRRQKKQLASKLRQLHASVNSQYQDLLAMQRMEANAFAAKQQLHQLVLDMGA